jgi:hypothetical protein
MNYIMNKGENLDKNIDLALKAVINNGKYNFEQFFYKKDKQTYIMNTPYNVLFAEIIQYFNLHKLDYLSSIETIHNIQIYILIELMKCKLNINDGPC